MTGINYLSCVTRLCCASADCHGYLSRVASARFRGGERYELPQTIRKRLRDA